jgi:putative PIN family toxin of toxin-antitoxin system
MKIVIDSNILFSALISPRGSNAKLVFLGELELFAPQDIFTELREHEQELKEKVAISEEEFELLILLFSSRISLVNYSEWLSHLNEADEFCPDKDDIAFFALCLAKEIPLWSNDKKLKKQNAVKVYNTQEIIQLLQQKQPPNL